MKNADFLELLKDASLIYRSVSKGGPMMATISEWYQLQDGRIVVRTAGMGGESFEFIEGAT